MRILNHLILIASIGLYSVNAVSEEKIVVQDGATVLTYEELADTVTRWTPQMREAALLDQGDRLELINLALANKKIAEEAENYVAEHPEIQLDYLNGLRGFQRNFMLRHVADNIEMPDFSTLAQEQYTVKKEKYALIPERRMSSHILFMSPPGRDRAELTTKAQSVLDQLRAGADFEEMVAQYSEEPNAAEKKGKFDRWLAFGEQGVSPRYSEGVFSIEKVGDYSDIVNSEFGLHIVRLDGIQERSFKPFEEVKEDIIKEMEAEYRRLAMKDFVSKFQITDEVTVDDEAISSILEPYNTTE
jgi:parvulin-like peptidyl-prolyl isomerase